MYASILPNEDEFNMKNMWRIVGLENFESYLRETGWLRGRVTSLRVSDVPHGSRENVMTLI